MWYYGFAVPSLLLLCIILCFYLSLPRLSIRVNKFFLYILILESMVIVMDILSSHVDSNISNMPLWVVHLANVFYFVLFFLRAEAFFSFTSCVFCHGIEAIGRLKQILLLMPCFISIFITFMTPWTGYIYGIENDKYVKGPLYNILYFVFGFYLACAFFIMFRYHKNVVKRRYFYAMFTSGVVLTLGIVLRYLFPQYLVLDTFCLMVILIIYLTFGNPEFFIESRGKVFNGKAFWNYMEENNGALSHKILLLVIKNYHEMREIYGGKQIDAGITMISRYVIRTFGNVTGFYYGDGRFILLGSDKIDYDNIMEKLRERFSYSWEGKDIELYLKEGFAFLDIGRSVDSMDTLLNAMMMAFDKAEKLESSDCFRMSDEQLKSVGETVEVKKSLERAVEEDRVEVFLQPIIEVSTDVAVGAEALCRIRDDSGKLIPPGKFIPIAEAGGKINQLGEQVFVKTCKFIRDNDLEKMGIKWINVNLSPVQFMKNDLADRYYSIAREYGVDPKTIRLEITEESLIDEGFLKKQVHAMQDKGFVFVLDDYGVGYSNLTRLKKISFVNVKLDMSVVRDYCKDPDEIIPGMVQAFKNMKFSVTAEGIEDKEMAEGMKNAGVNYFQGFYYSRPLPMDEFLNMYSRTGNA